MAMSKNPSRPLRALIVDDDPVIRVFAADALEAIGFESVEVESGEEALEFVSRSTPDLILLDLRMPGMDGFATCRRLRERPETRDTPIIITTGSTDSSTIDRAFHAKATDFIAKPIDSQLLKHRVRFVMSARDAFQYLQDTLDNLEVSEERLANAQRIAKIGHYELELETGAMLCSEEFLRVLDLPPGAMDGMGTFIELVHPDDRRAVELGLRGVARGSTWDGEHRIISARGTHRTLWHRAEIKGTPTDERTWISGMVQDVSERCRNEERIRYLAYYDPLTQLPNRNFLLERLQRIVDRGHRSGGKVALVCMGLDRFKRINDTLGHRVGDEALRNVARRLENCVRASDFVGCASDADSGLSHPGGDEFTLVLSGIDSEKSVRQAVLRLMAAFDEPIRVDDRQISLSVSFGIAVGPTDGESAEILLKNANLAMSRAKEAGSGAHRFFDASMNDRAMERLALECDVRDALGRGEFWLAYQPIIDAQRKVMSGAEALMRWNHPTQGPISPAVFIPVAEEMGLIVDLLDWTLREACGQARAWQDAGHPPIRMAVNVSSVMFSREGLVGAVEAALEKTGLDPNFLELEITETALLANESHAAVILEQLRARGIRVSLDDFGTGYSSLTHLVRLPITTIKIDRSFVMRIGEDGVSEEIITGVIALAQRLDLGMVAEGVETEEQERFLRAEGCNVLQGLRFAPASRPAEIERMLSSGTILGLKEASRKTGESSI